jgi:hypothetical protein
LHHAKTVQSFAHSSASLIHFLNLRKPTRVEIADCTRLIQAYQRSATPEMLTVSTRLSHRKRHAGLIVAALVSAATANMIRLVALTHFVNLPTRFHSSLTA